MNPAEQQGTDVEAITEGFVSITPVTLDWTAHSFVGELEHAFRHPAKPKA
jgi:5'-nucleotidase